MGDETTEAIAPRLSEAAQVQPADNQAVLGTAEPPAEAFVEKAESVQGDENAATTNAQIPKVSDVQPTDSQVVLKTAEHPVALFPEKAELVPGDETAGTTISQASEGSATQLTAGQVVLKTPEPSKAAFMEKNEPVSGDKNTEITGDQTLEVSGVSPADQPVDSKTAEPHQEAFSGKSEPATLHKPTPKRPSLEIEEGTTLFIRYAGMILLHPYLLPFFKGLDLVEDKNFKDDACRHRAVHLLHYLTTKETGLPEFVLLLPKLLCGLPFEEPMERYLEFSETEVAECENLLQAVIQHWGALGKSSPDALREGFLQREGKLEKRESGWHLTVERHTIDILLDRLPWGLGIVKLPWMEELLQVEWA